MASIDIPSTDASEPVATHSVGGSVANISIESSADGFRIHVTGVWSLRTLGAVWDDLAGLRDRVQDKSHPVTIDAQRVESFDVSGAWAIKDLRDRMVESGLAVELLSSERLAAVMSRMKSQERSLSIAEPPQEDAVVGALAGLGKRVAKGTKDVLGGLDLAGALMLWVLTAARRGGLRPRSIATHAIRMGIGAVPVVAISSFLVGGVIAQQSAYQLKDFGAETLAVDLSSYMIFRELAVLIAAIMVAGRSASAIAAEIGAMKMREEVDALTVMGL
ncbi:MAG: ABC transporter permease, partial [Pseudomonadota bacterium]